MQPARRSAARYRVYLSVRYEAAADFVREYAEDLSRGGLFIRGARGLNRRRDVIVEIELPGYGTYQVRAEVVHTISDEMAREYGRAAGAGLAIRDAPAGFDEALSGYLVRLGHRSDSIVVVQHGESSRLLHAAGYQVRDVDSAEDLGGVLDACDVQVVGVVVPAADIGSYQRAGRGAGDLLVPMDGAAQLDEVLVRLDGRL